MTTKRISLNVINGLAPSPAGGTKKVVWDLQVPGFGAYKTGSGRVSFLYQFRMGGEPTQSLKIGNLGEMTIDEARAVAGDFAQQRRRGVNPVEELKRAKTEEAARVELVLSVYAEGYIERRIAKGKPLNKAQTGIIRRDIIGLLGDVRIDRMVVEEVEGFAATLAERGPSARRMGLTYLKAILNDAIARRKISVSPADAVDTNKAGERARRLREDELVRFLEASNDLGDCRGDICEVLVRMLKRKEEISRMKWQDLDLAKSVWFLASTRNKGGEPHRIQLPRQVRAIIERQQPDPRLRVGPVFTLDGGRSSPEMGSQVKDLADANMHRRLELANERDGTALRVTHFTIHDLRTTGASTLHEKPFLVSTAIIDAILLHTMPGKVSRTYQRATLEEEAGDALQIWNDHLDRLMSRGDAFPGGRDLPPMGNPERKRRIALLREGWPSAPTRRRQRSAGRKRPPAASGVAAAASLRKGLSQMVPPRGGSRTLPPRFAFGVGHSRLRKQMGETTLRGCFPGRSPFGG